VPATKEQIADTFEKHVQRFGFSKATVEDVAAELGISKKTIYEHFDSKRDLYAYVVERIARSWRGELRAAIENCATYGERFEVLARLVVQGARAHILETSKADWEQEYEIVGEGLMKAVGDVMHEVIGGGIDAGEFAMTDAAVGERLVGAVMLEYTLIVREDPKTDVDDECVAAVRRFLG
jgi:AcrR family transcriptional regulator